MKRLCSVSVLLTWRKDDLLWNCLEIFPNDHYKHDILELWYYVNYGYHLGPKTHVGAVPLSRIRENISLVSAWIRSAGNTICGLSTLKTLVIQCCRTGLIQTNLKAILTSYSSFFVKKSTKSWRKIEGMYFGGILDTKIMVKK